LENPFHSDLMPTIPFHVGIREMGHLFANFGMAWLTLMPVLVVLFGIILGFGIARMIKDEHDSEKKILTSIRNKFSGRR
jgi:fumarate reductase subunit D